MHQAHTQPSLYIVQYDYLLLFLSSLLLLLLLFSALTLIKCTQLFSALNALVLHVHL